MSKTTTTPIDMLFNMEKQHRQRLNVSPTTNGKTLSFRPYVLILVFLLFIKIKYINSELPIRRLNISPPEMMKPRYYYPKSCFKVHYHTHVSFHCLVFLEKKLDSIK